MQNGPVDHEAMRRAFAWSIPEKYNIGVDVCDRWALADPQRPAIIEIAADGAAKPVSYGQLREKSDQLASALRARGVKRGDIIAILLPQSPLVAIIHIAIYKLGAIALPLACLFGVEALDYRLQDSGARALICDGAGLAKVTPLRPHLPALDIVLCIDGAAAGAEDLFAAVAGARPEFTPVNTLAEDPALMIYTSGTTGPAKGALHAHRVLLGHLPGVQMPHDDFPQKGDLMWTPADWAWAGGLLNVLLPSLHYGIAVVAKKFEKFDPDAAYDLLARHGVRNAYIPPTALRMLRSIKPPAPGKLSLRSVNTGGESLGAEVYEWGKQALGLTINESYGQTECNLVLASRASIGVSRAGSIGKPVCGHGVAIIRADGSICDDGETGQIAIRRPNPVMFLNYWKRPEATEQKFLGDWMLTGDQAMRDADGYVFFLGRDDDVISSAGYRIGPTEIEDSLLRHPAVFLAAAVGKPDALRGEIVKAFIILKPGYAASLELSAEIQAQVKTRLSGHEYPREIELVPELPLTTSGKIIRRLLRDRG